MTSIGLCILTPGPLLVLLYGEIMELLGQEALLKSLTGAGLPHFQFVLSVL